MAASCAAGVAFAGCSTATTNGSPTRGSANTPGPPGGFASATSRRSSTTSVLLTCSGPPTGGWPGPWSGSWRRPTLRSTYGRLSTPSGGGCGTSIRSCTRRSYGSSGGRRARASGGCALSARPDPRHRSQGTGTNTGRSSVTWSWTRWWAAARTYVANSRNES